MDWLENTYLEHLLEPDFRDEVNGRSYRSKRNNKITYKSKKMTNKSSTRPTFSKRSLSKRGNPIVTKGYSKKGESKIVKTIGYKTKNSKYGTAGKRKMVITTIKKLTKR
ncbi:MAG: hypothetical protein ACJA1D_000191 [Polaribacter sp.]|jgi:hypothetical protein